MTIDNPQNMTNEELAEKFQTVADDFFNFIKNNKLEDVIIDMDEGFDLRGTRESLCGTPACHGGWAAIMYQDELDLKRFYDSSEFYLLGADTLSFKLGFESISSYKIWAVRNPNYWGCSYGAEMFSRQPAFGKSHDDELTLTDIAVWYQNIANRLRGDLPSL